MPPEVHLRILYERPAKLCEPFACQVAMWRSQRTHADTIGSASVLALEARPPPGGPLFVARQVPRLPIASDIPTQLRSTPALIPYGSGLLRRTYGTLAQPLTVPALCLCAQNDLWRARTPASARRSHGPQSTLRPKVRRDLPLHVLPRPAERAVPWHKPASFTGRSRRSGPGRVAVTVFQQSSWGDWVRCSPIWPCSGRGLASRHVAMPLVGSYPTISPLPAPQRAAMPGQRRIRCTCLRHEPGPVFDGRPAIGSLPSQLEGLPVGNFPAARARQLAAAVGGMVSVPLSVGLRRLGVTQRPALRSPDFPHRDVRASDRPQGPAKVRHRGATAWPTLAFSVYHQAS